MVGRAPILGPWTSMQLDPGKAGYLLLLLICERGAQTVRFPFLHSHSYACVSQDQIYAKVWMVDNKYFPRNHFDIMKEFWKGKSEYGEEYLMLVLLSWTTEWFSPQDLTGISEIHFPQVCGSFLRHPTTFSSSILNAMSFSEISAMAQMEKLDSDCKKICVLWDMYLVPSLWKSIATLPDLGFMQSLRRSPVEPAAVPCYRCIPSGTGPSPAVVHNGADDFLQL